jgi:hypothetical protein
LGTGNPKGLYKITKSAKVTYNKESVISGGQQSHRCQEEFENTKGVIRIRISKKNRQHNGQQKKYKSTNNDPQNMHIKLKIEQHEPH